MHKVPVKKFQIFIATFIPLQKGKGMTCNDFRKRLTILQLGMTSVGPELFDLSSLYHGISWDVFKASVELNALGSHQRSALYLAAEMGHLEVADLLLEAMGGFWWLNWEPWKSDQVVSKRVPTQLNIIKQHGDVNSGLLSFKR